jgi:hypothetical protein
MDQPPTVPSVYGEFHDMVRDRAESEFKRLLRELDSALDLIGEQAAIVVQQQLKPPKEEG